MAHTTNNEMIPPKTIVAISVDTRTLFLSVRMTTNRKQWKAKRNIAVRYMPSRRKRVPRVQLRKLSKDRGIESVEANKKIGRGH